MCKEPIPKIIHYCWFGGAPLSELTQKCIASWKKNCPDYVIKRWDETNFDINYNDYVREAYEAKKWAFVTDVVRLYALVTFGGIYMDTDVEMLKPIDEFLKYEAFSGFETDDRIPTGIIASTRGQKLFEELLHDYDSEHFLKPDGSLNLITNVIRITDTCRRYGLIQNNSFQTVRGFTLFPRDYFCPKDCATKELRITDNTYTIHHFDGSWVPPDRRLADRLSVKLQKFMPKIIAGYVAVFVATWKIKGFGEAINLIVRRRSLKNSGDKGGVLSNPYNGLVGSRAICLFNGGLA